MPIIANFLSGGNNSGVVLGNVSNIQTVVASEKVYIKWTDPDDLVVSGVVIGEWAGTLLVRKAGSAPTSRRDGTIIFDNKTRNAYAESYFVDSGLSNGVTYYYKLFPYTTGHSYADNEANMFYVKPVSIAPGNVDNISATAGSHKIYLSWTDPDNVIVDDIAVSEWAGTKVVYRTDRYPTSVNDGTLAINSITKNAYQNTPLTISGLTNDETYYIGLFPYAVGGGINTNEENRVSATPKYQVITAEFGRVGMMVYNGEVQSPVWENYDTSIVSIGGETYGTNAGTYRAIFTIINTDYCWSDGSITPKTYEWTIMRKSIATIPSQKGELIYSGGQQAPAWNDYNSTELTLGGVTVGTNAGTYEATFTPTANYQWSDKTITAKTVSWTIGKKSIATIPAQSGTLTYNGNAQSPSWSNYNSTELVLGGIASGTDAGSYIATFAPNSNHVWSDGSITSKPVTWNIGKAVGTFHLSASSAVLRNSNLTANIEVSLLYDGEIVAVSADEKIATVSVSGTTLTVSHVNKAHGNTTITVSVKESNNYTAASAQNISVTAIFPKVDVPSQKGTLTYSGAEQEPVWAGYDSAQLSISGTLSGINAGSYHAYFTPIGDYSWSDGSITAKTVNWTIGKAVGSFSLSETSVTLRNSATTASVTVDRLGNGAVSAVSSNTSIATVSVSGTTITISHVNKAHGSATITVSVGAGDNYLAASNKTIAVTANFPKITTVPSQSGTLTYSGSALSPTWSNYNADQLTLDGTVSGVNAGSYTATFTPKGDYSWSDGSVIAKNVTWNISKAVGSLSVNPTAITLNGTNLTKTIAVTRAGDGKITATSSDTKIATVSVSDTTVTVSHVNQTSGSATVTISVTAGTNHNAPSNKTVSVTAEFLPAIGRALNEYTWAEISRVSNAGQAANYWNVGDRKAVALNGTVASLAINETYYCYIIGFDHNSSIEGANRIHFQFGTTKLTGSSQFAFVDSAYGGNNNGGFAMFTSNSNAGGWGASVMRTSTCPAFKNAMPTDLQSVLKTVIKYTDNTGGGGSDASYVTATTDEIFLLAEYEVFGYRDLANSTEPTYQKQYTYYATGNSKSRLKPGTADGWVYWWLRSPAKVYGTNNSFCRVDLEDESSYYPCYGSYGFTPAFCV